MHERRPISSSVYSPGDIHCTNVLSVQLRPLAEVLVIYGQLLQRGQTVQSGANPEKADRYLCKAERIISLGRKMDFFAKRH